MQRHIKIATIFGILAGIYFILPYCFGIAAKHYAFTFLENENQTLGKVLGIHLDFDQYDRGWFHSSAVLKIEKRSADGHWEIIKKIPLVIDHGPAYREENKFQDGLGMIKSSGLQLDNFPYQITFSDNIGFSRQEGIFELTPNKSSTYKPEFQMSSLVLYTNSNLKATDFQFNVVGQGLHFQDPQQSYSLNLQNLQTMVTANYLDDRHWQMTVGLNLEKNQLTTVLPNDSSSVTVNADKININGMHFDTQQIAKVLAEVVQLKQAADEQRPTKPTAWMALLQQLITQIVHNDTSAEIKGLSFVTPMGQVDVQYIVSFPTLKTEHDYFDVATRNVGNLEVEIPNWKFVNTDANMMFALSNFQYNEKNNTVFSRHSKMTLGAVNISNVQSTGNTHIFYAAGLSYEGELHGDPKHLSQTMGWDLSKLCFSDNCFNKIHGKLELLQMNFDAFRGIAAATQQVVQYDPQQTESIGARWMDLASAYAKLISPDSQVILSHDMMTPFGEVHVQGQLTWPGLASQSTSVSEAFPAFLDQTVYQLHMIFPAAYVNAFLNQQTTAPEPAPAPVTQNAASPAAPPVASVTAEKTPAFEVQAAQFVQYALNQGYLKKVGDAYTVDLAGKGSVLTINGIPWKMPG
ncbi:MAG: hypothetical protein A3F13_00655 [Gammaproteobacteria bacterium RIFCSPHIGHO2_12_FULL_40_19]|nr:MAG: hypothetical protein A3F13_00655 [Gammaproteobacteria bacterium RIFCSPHIGHO2_12_FULL_40_19]